MLRNGDVSILLFLIFPGLILCSLLAQHLVGKMRWEIHMAEYIQERGPVEQVPPLPPEEERLPGYTTLTYEDYEEITSTLRASLLAEMRAPSQRNGKAYDESIAETDSGRGDAGDHSQHGGDGIVRVDDGI